MTSKFFQPLVKSSQEFFTESLHCYERKRFNLSVVSAYTAVELMMKARMCMIHDALRLDSLNERKQDHTIKWGELSFRLETLGINLLEDEKALMKKISEWRNDIVHCVPHHDEETVKARLPQAFEFISNFSMREFGKQNRLLTISERRQIRAAKKRALIEQKDARKAAKAEGKIIKLACPNCGLHGTVCQRPNDDLNAYCHYCKTSLIWEKCRFCPRKLLSKNIYEEEFYHDDCLNDYASDYYSSMAEDRGR